MNSFKIIVSREGAPLPASAGVVDHDVIHSGTYTYSCNPAILSPRRADDHDVPVPYAPAAAMEEKKQCEFILEDGEYVVIGKAGMALQTAKSFIKMEPTEDGGMMVKVESSYKLLPVPSVEKAQDEIAETHKINEMGGGGGPNFKVKLD